MTLLDSQFDASSSYAEGATDAEKTQSRIDHMPSMGQVNNTNGRGTYNIGLYSVWQNDLYSQTCIKLSPLGNGQLTA